MSENSALPKFHTHMQKGHYLESQKRIIITAVCENILHARGAAAARKFWKRIAADPLFAKKVVDLANAG